jgi:hypothetical protein
MRLHTGGAYGLATSGIVDIETKNGLFAPGGQVTMYGGSYATLRRQPKLRSAVS